MEGHLFVTNRLTKKLNVVRIVENQARIIGGRGPRLSGPRLLRGRRNFRIQNDQSGTRPFDTIEQLCMANGMVKKTKTEHDIE